MWCIALSDSAETAAALPGGLVLINVLNPEQDILFSQNYACEDCGVSIEELTPRMFSFNNPFGACPACTGLGSQLKVDPELVIPNKTLSILDGAICASGVEQRARRRHLEDVLRRAVEEISFLAARAGGKTRRRSWT